MQKLFENSLFIQFDEQVLKSFQEKLIPETQQISAAVYNYVVAKR